MNNITPGFDSLMNESRFDLRRGDRVAFLDRNGNKCVGKYVMASSADGYIVLNIGGRYGTPHVLNSRDIVTVNGKKYEKAE